jgi:hypothetical protein
VSQQRPLLPNGQPARVSVQLLAELRWSEVRDAYQRVRQLALLRRVHLFADPERRGLHVLLPCGLHWHAVQHAHHLLQRVVVCGTTVQERRHVCRETARCL